jgi:pentapeptide MXKDX repeat protein
LTRSSDCGIGYRLEAPRRSPAYAAILASVLDSAGNRGIVSFGLPAGLAAACLASSGAIALADAVHCATVTFRTPAHPISARRSELAGIKSRLIQGETMKKLFSSLMLASALTASMAAFAQDQMKQDDMKKDDAKQDTMKNDSMKNDQMKSDKPATAKTSKPKTKKAAKQDAMKHDDMKKDDMKKDDMKKDDSMKNDQMKPN